MRILPILLSENWVQIGGILMEKQGFDGQKVGFAIQKLAESYTVGTTCYTNVSRKLYSWYHMLCECYQEAIRLVPHAIRMLAANYVGVT